MKQIPVGFTERHREMIEEIQKELGYPTLTSVVHQAIADLYQAMQTLKQKDNQ